MFSANYRAWYHWIGLDYRLLKNGNKKTLFKKLATSYLSSIYMLESSILQRKTNNKSIVVYKVPENLWEGNTYNRDNLLLLL